MRELSEYKLLGNYLVNLYEKYGVDTIRYENAHMVTSNILNKLKDVDNNYNIIPIEQKYDIVKSMISKGVFRTNPGNKIAPFKQVYNYEVSKGIVAVYSCDKSLVFKIPNIANISRDSQLKNLREIYCNDIGLVLQNAVDVQLKAYKPQTNRIR